MQQIKKWPSSPHSLSCSSLSNTWCYINPSCHWTPTAERKTATDAACLRETSSPHFPPYRVFQLQVPSLTSLTIQCNTYGFTVPAPMGSTPSPSFLSQLVSALNSLLLLPGKLFTFNPTICPVIPIHLFLQEVFTLPPGLDLSPMLSALTCVLKCSSLEGEWIRV